MSRRIIYTGIRELQDIGEGDADHPRRPSSDAKRIRRRGGGRPKASERQAGPEETLKAHGAGSPTDEAPSSTGCSAKSSAASQRGHPRLAANRLGGR